MTIRLANADGRATLLVGDGVVDVERASGGRFPAEPMGAMAHWDALAEWAADLDDSAADGPIDLSVLGPPVPRPGKIFAVGLNYATHARESGMAVPAQPSVFTKFPTCLVGPTADVVLPSAFCDWEVELVAVVGRGGRRIAEHEALDHVAGYCIGQDISERRVQMAGNPPQFSMGKSFDTFGPTGPAIVSLDAFADPLDVGLWCDVSGERVQDGRTRDLIFNVPALVAYLSGICTLEAGDLIFTGTPDGVGTARTPPRYLREGDTIVSAIEGAGTLTNLCTRV